MLLSLSKADSKTCPTVNVQRLTQRALPALYRLTETYAKILKIFRKGCLPDKGNTILRSLTPIYLVSQLFPKRGVWNAPARV